MYYDIIFKIFYNCMINKANLYYLHYFFDLIAIYIRMPAAPKTMRNDEIKKTEKRREKNAVSHTFLQIVKRFIAAP